jgi:mRNA interferase RelE/StbE
MVDGTCKLRVSDATPALIRTMHPQLKRKVRAALQSIQSDPPLGKAIKDELAGLRSFRIGRIRVIYREERGSYIDIVAVGPRRSIYEETYRIIHREER